MIAAGTPAAADSTEPLRTAVHAALMTRAARLRVSLPPRPAAGQPGRYEWWRNLTPGQERTAMLLDRLEALAERLAAAPALGVPTVLSAAALEAADDPVDDVHLVAALRARTASA